MAEIVIAVAGKVSEYLVAPIGRQLGYLFCYRRYTDELRDKVQTLGTRRNDLQISVDEARRRGHEIRPIVEEWLNRVDQTTGEAEKLMITDENKSCFNLNLKSRYQLGREAYKKAQLIDKIQTDRNFPDGVSYHVPPRTATFKGYESYESRESTLSKIIDALRDQKTKMIGVWGMGGVGKTTLLKQLVELAKQQNLFTTQVYIDVSWTRDEGDKIVEEGISKIQQHIAEKLGLELKEKSIPVRADKLMRRLKTEKILIVLDDMWKTVNMEEVGLPSYYDDQKDCKIVLASRDEDILCRNMGAQDCFQIKHLDEKEGWQLFKKTAGDSVELRLRSTAMEIAKECQGLPVAIVTIANALKDKSEAVWKNALDELKNSAPTNITGVHEKVYGCLKWSYNNLTSNEAKSLFLLCGSLGYGDISMYELLRYALGLDFFDRIKSLEQARNRLVALVRTLKASSLLLDGEDDSGECYYGEGNSRLLFMDADDNKTVRLHDVVRDVARNIASQHPRPFLVGEDVILEDWSEETDDEHKRCALISRAGKAVNKLPQRLVCPELKFFLWQDYDPYLKIPDTFFEGMNRLKVLDLSEMAFTTLPSTLQSLVNLRTLCLDWCYELEDIALIGGLKKLQVLSMVRCGIQQLPQEMAQLTNLRLLNLTDCKNLEVIPQDILSSLSELECLFIEGSFRDWAAVEVSDVRQSNNACLSELNHLHRLRTIDITIPDMKLLPEDDNFFKNLTSFAITMGDFWRFKRYEKSKTLFLYGGDESLLLRKGISTLLEKTEDIWLKGWKGQATIPQRSFHYLKALEVDSCGELKFGYSRSDKMETTSQGINHMPFFSHQVSFPKLEEVRLSDLPELKEIWHAHRLPALNSFSNLRILRLERCGGLLTLIPSHLIHSFRNLKEIQVRLCEVLEYVLDLQGYDYSTDINIDGESEILPKLETFKLENLAGLKGIIKCNNDGSSNIRGLFSSPMPLSFHSLKYLSISDCGKKDQEQENAVTPTATEDDVVLFGEKVSFPNLEKLYITDLSILKMVWHPPLNLIPSHLTLSFQNLKEVHVKSCEVLEYMFDPRGLNRDGRILPKLEILMLKKLPKLKLAFYKEDMKVWEHIKVIEIIDCGMPLDEKVSFSSNLEKLVLERFYKLKEIDFGSHPKLRELELKKLPQLRSIQSGKCLFSPSTFENFHHLEDVNITECGLEDKKRDVDTPANAAELSNEKLSLLDGEALESRVSTLNKIMDAIRDVNINLIGVVGLVGVGKTTLVKQVAQQAKLQNLFNKQLYIDTSWWNPESNKENVISGIQQKMAEMLFRITEEYWYWDEATIIAEMKQRLKKEKILIILDGVWKDIDLEKFGIPSRKDDDDDDEKYKCKILLTCRDEEYIGAQICFPVEILQPEEGWTLFKNTTGDWVEESGELLRSVAIQVVEECEGLPITIMTIAKALKDEITLAVWNNALEHLRNNRSNPAAASASTGGREKAVYSSCLKWSYTHLKSDDAKLLLSLCGSTLSYYGDDVSVYRLLQYALGLDLFGDISSLEQAINRLLELVELLKALGWLLESHRPQHRNNFSDDERDSSSLFFVDTHENKFVMMHDDVVYDVVREIASKRPHPFVFGEDVVGLKEWSETSFKESKTYNFFSLHCKYGNHEQLPQALVCPELQFFLLRNYNNSISNTFFQGMKKLQVLDLSCMRFTTLPSSLSFLANLRTLCLDGCENLVDIGHIGKLTKLKVLSFRRSRIKRLPDEMTQLTHLRLLDLGNCSELEVMPWHILSSLSKLQCLLIEYSFKEWTAGVEGEGDESNNANVNARLCELNHLSCLTTLPPHISNAKLPPKDIFQFENLTSYTILIGGGGLNSACRTNRTMKLKKVNRRLHLGDTDGIISKLLERSKELEFQKLSGTNYVLFYPSNQKSFNELKHLRVSNSSEIQYIIDSILLTEDDQQSAFQEHGFAFPLLESLVLQWLDNLQEVWHGCPIPRGSFGNLKTLELYSCSKLRYLFSLSMARGLSRIEDMTIDNCCEMQQVVKAYERELEDEYGGRGTTINFQLFPNLRILKLQNLPELINFISETETTSSTCLSHKVSFSKLEELIVKNVPKLKDIWNPRYPFGSFSNLRTLISSNLQLV